MVFHDSLLEHSCRFWPKYLCYFPYSLRKKRDEIDKTILLLRGADVTEELRFFKKLKCMCYYVHLIKQLEVIPFSCTQDFSSVGFWTLSETEKSKVVSKVIAEWERFLQVNFFPSVTSQFRMQGMLRGKLISHLSGKGHAF